MRDGRHGLDDAGRDAYSTWCCWTSMLPGLDGLSLLSHCGASRRHQ
ncbi:hypothetical protein ACPA9J_00810 [Pseudomonas aeruginosa]